jgi:hypothetical protein
MPLGADRFQPGSPGTTESQFKQLLQVQFMQAFVSDGTADETPSQQAVEAALLQQVGIKFADQPSLKSIARQGPGPDIGKDNGSIYAAAGRLVTLSPAAENAWLSANLAAVRSGALTLEQLP